jgi:uncharacterized membrane protein YfhO
MNELEFDPAAISYLESDIPGLQAPVNAVANQTVAEMHLLEYEVSTESNSLLVLSEIYYPAGWKAYLDKAEIPIHPVNYILRGVVIPPGEHKLELVFSPESYSQGITLSAIGLIVTLLCLIGGFALECKKKNETIEK